jgi:putative heme-binding domain-containing protein
MNPGSAALKKFTRMAKSETSAVVRLYLASSLQRIPKATIWDIAAGLLGHAEDIDDHNIPKMIWFGVEPQVAGDPEMALKLASNSRIPMVAQFIARRATSEQLLDEVIEAISKTDSSGTKKLLLEGLRDGLLGQRDLTAPKGWSKIEAGLLKEENETRNLALQVGQLFGSAEAGKAQLAQLNNVSTPLERRKEILHNFGQDVFPPAFEAILGLLDNPDLRLSALRTLSSYEGEEIQTKILKNYYRFTQDEKTVAVQTLAIRRNSALVLVSALKNSTIPRTDISAVIARQLRRVVGPSFLDFWGPIESLAKDKQIAMDRYKFLLTDEYVAHADVKNGKSIFDQTCAACHKMYGSGGEIGPDITGSNRANLDYILTNIIDPSSEIPEGYQLVTIITQDGRTFAGNIKAEDDQRVTLRLIGQDMVVAKSEILSRQTSEMSMMPEGQLNALSDSQVRDLIAYLRTAQPLN